MNFDEPSAELDFAVAKAVGIEAYPREEMCFRLCFVAGLPDKTKQRLFCPSRDMNDAMEAADKVGLFSTCELGTAQYTMEWWVSRWEHRDGELGLWHFADGPTAALAISAAILKLTEEDHG